MNKQNEKLENSAYVPNLELSAVGHSGAPVTSEITLAHPTLGEQKELAPNLSLKAIRLDGGTQSRAAMDDAAVVEYTDAIREGAVLPPLIVYFDGGDYWLADGFHRAHAYQAAGVEKVPAEVRTGSKRDAVLHSVGANAAHGLRRTNADKRRAVEMLLADTEWATWSDNQIGKACGVSNHLVAEVRSSVTLNSPSDAASTERSYTTKHGTKASMNTAKIGRTKPTKMPQAGDIAADDAPSTEPNLAAGTPKAIHTDAAVASELAVLREENAALREELEDLKASFAETLADNENMGRVIDADDQLKAAMEENRRLRVVVGSAERTLRAKSGECAEAIRAVRSWKKRAEKAEKTLAKAA